MDQTNPTFSSDGVSAPANRISGNMDGKTLADTNPHPGFGRAAKPCQTTAMLPLQAIHGCARLMQH
jgi:hypothetical protein